MVFLLDKEIIEDFFLCIVSGKLIVSFFVEIL